MATTKAAAVAAKKKRAGKAPAPRKRSVLSQAGDDAKAAAERVLLLSTLEANGWSLTATASSLRMGPATAVSRALRELAPAEYEAAKADGRISQGNRRPA